MSINKTASPLRHRLGVACAFVSCAAGVLKAAPQAAALFPAGFEKVSSEIVTNTDMFAGTMDCGKFLKATDLWLKETDPTRKLYAKTCLQEILGGFFQKIQDCKLDNLTLADRAKFDKRIMDVLAGGELDQAEVQTKQQAKRVHLKVIHNLNMNLDEMVVCIRRNNEGCIILEVGDELESRAWWFPLSITAVSPDKFQVFASFGLNSCIGTATHGEDLQSGHYDLPNTQYEFGLTGFLFGKEGQLASSFTDRGALAGCFNCEDEALLVSNQEREKEYGSGVEYSSTCLIKLRSPQGKNLWTSSVSYPQPASPCYPHWSVWPSAQRDKWMVEMWTRDYHGVYEDNYFCWEVKRQPKIELRKTREIRTSEEAVRPLDVKPVNSAFRYSRSTYHHSIDANGQAGFTVFYGRHAFSPLCMDGYESPLKPSSDQENLEQADAQFLSFPKPSETAFLRNTWPTSRDFFVGSECYSPFFGEFLKARKGVPWSENKATTYFDWSVKPTGESATFFYDPSGDLKAWSMGYIAGDAEDGRSLLVTRANGQLLTISPEYKVSNVRSFVTLDGQEAKPLLMLDSHHAGIFLVGKSIVVGTWKPPLLERLFPSAGKRKNNEQHSQDEARSASREPRS